uniref:Uncharacterized protein n=1 Tax=Anopheles melas TaxID=34690 RepID=A0A182TXY4_9DIPT
MSPAPAAVHEEMEMRQCSEINKREHWRRKTGGSWLHGRPACSRLERCAATVATVGLLWLAVGSTLAVASSVHDGHCKHQHPKAHEHSNNAHILRKCKHLGLLESVRNGSINPGQAGDGYWLLRLAGW